MHIIKIADTEQKIQRCYPVMLQLRPHLDLDEFLSRVKSQYQVGYQLAYIEEKDGIAIIAGFRTAHNLSWGRHLYVDDLVTDESKRSKGFGKVLMQWLIQEAKKKGCNKIHLDSGIQRKDAHRFYEHEGMTLSCYHYELTI